MQVVFSRGESAASIPLLVNAARQAVQEARQHEQQVREPVEVLKDGRIDSVRFGQHDDRALGATTYGARHMSLRSGQEQPYWNGGQSLYGNPGKDLILRFRGEEVGRMSMDFLHEGIPMPVREASMAGRS